MSVMWPRYGDPDDAPPRPDPMIELGHLNCQGWTIPETLYQGCMVVGVHALYPDGSERLLTEEPKTSGCSAKQRQPAA